MKLIDKIDFACVGDIAKHCDYSKLCIAEDEAINFDLKGLFCDYWNEIKSIWKEIEGYKNNPEEEKPENYDLKDNLINGGSFSSCNGKTSDHLGVKRILIYYTYSRYTIINGFNDTPNGSVQKTNEFTIPKTIKELELFADKYRSMGYESYKDTLKFLCHNKDVFSEFNHKDCSKCGCACESCNGKTRVKGYGFKSSIIRK